MEDKNKEGLATEKDIDPRFGLFEDQREGSRVQGAEEELLRTYPSGEGTYGTVQVDSYTVSSSQANAALADDVDGAEAPSPDQYAKQRDGGDYAEEVPVGVRTVNADPDLLDLADDTPVDPAAPPDEFHGTDLLNGVGAHPEEEDRE
ncbi:hypothetical protein VE23_08805 [Paenibacillus sp. D9]|uniref:hypothetical protein n=1 Tax=Paenibacillus sp. D9 TaxID=665792 RepID=UPI00061E5435|nr:hypothetical protein [Paenibacillus sp. D9]KKC47229.1 hypothetical protein VE23_08805 [Paenibacillus sp. D9]